MYFFHTSLCIICSVVSALQFLLCSYARTPYKHTVIAALVSANHITRDRVMSPVTTGIYFVILLPGNLSYIG